MSGGAAQGGPARLSPMTRIEAPSHPLTRAVANTLALSMSTARTPLAPKELRFLSCLAVRRS
jgi:hypothetical protein